MWKGGRKRGREKKRPGVVVPTLSRQRQVDLKVSLVYTRFQDSQDYDNKNCL